MYSLYIDTHYLDVIIVLYKDGLLIDKSINSNLKHSTITMPMIVELLGKNNINIHDINEIICVNGPGSFTGVRIGVTISKMLGISLGIKIKVIDYLKLMAIHVDREEKWVSIVDKNGAFVGHFDGFNEPIEEYKYYNKTDYSLLVDKVTIVDNVEIDFNQLYGFLKSYDYVEPHLVNPIYVKNVVV